MHPKWPILLVLTCLLLVVNSGAQQRSASNFAPLQNRLTALATTEIHDVTLTGHALRSAGATTESGQAELKALVTGEARTDMSFPSGPSSEVYARGARGAVGQWTGQDQKAHAIAPANLLAEPAWFCPALVLRKMAAQSANLTVSEGAARSGTLAFQHVRVVRQPEPAGGELCLSDDVIEMARAATQVDWYFDPSTSLPVEMDFKIHPDNEIHQNVPVRVRYSDYRSINGIQTPFHIRKLINNSLVLDLQLDAASFNTGMGPQSFAVR